MTKYVRLIDLPDVIDSNIHDGFTIGKKGKVMFWYMLFSCTSNNCAVVTPELPPVRRYIDKDSIVKLHYKQR